MIADLSILADPRALLEAPLAQPARRVARALRAAGHETYFAGGCVRDALLGRAPKDVDVATAALPDDVEALFPKTAAVGKAFGVIIVVQDGSPVEVATFRTDGPYADGRRPDSVAFRSAREDALRRDFTVNGLFLDPETAEVVDFVEGVAALRAGRIEAIGDPEARFRDDHLRMLRAVRFAGTLGFTIAPETAGAIRRFAPLVAKVSGERIGQELLRCFAEAHRAGDTVRLLADLGLLDVVLPEVAAMRGVEQPPQYHPEGDVFTHTCLMLDGLPPPPRDTRLALAVLLHDVGKPPTASVERLPDGGEIIRFREHAPRGAELAEAILRRLKLPGDTIGDVVAMVGRHMTFVDATKMRPATLRRFMAQPTFPLELELARLDALHSSGDLSDHAFVAARHEEFRSEPVLPARWVTGKDLLALGCREGPEVGALLDAAYDRQLEGLEPDRDALLAWVRGHLQSAGEAAAVRPRRKQQGIRR